MKKILLMAVVMLASVASYAQQAVGTFTLQPKIGMNVASLTKSDGADPRIGLAAGVEAEYQATDIFSISAGVIYSMQGNKYDYDVLGKKTVTKTNKLDYINIPILANVYVVKGLAVKLGIQPAFKVNDQIKTSVDEGSTTADVDKAESFDFSIPVGLSYEYSNVVFDARYNFGVTKVWDGGDPMNSVFQITLGYKFAL
ncbi:porin family protein [Prevotella sp.]|uniref:porin family protein n=1 Tax=Prevotella sp. TaxID=59823 RepID=UPI0025DD7616|nr:porin family protein [Prevotella sp.]